ncbi:DUF4374 domain-containing protein [Sporocytophaga myxococcoides]|uniref:DUF4374 domain-containing protein n=1 Tax=Sporocytophaga myxococcoides TaxID=153721 RepID=UPI000429233F|nr:DUF4374 domain-containing protein [Sporocytophaga myxococcoides]
MKNKNQWICMALGLGLFVASSCEKKKDPSPGEVGGLTGQTKYVIAASPEGTLGESSNYLLTSGDLTSGSISTKGNGIEQDGYRYYVFHKNKVFSLLYGQGNPGAVTAYMLNTAGELQKTHELQTESVHVFGTVNDEILLIKVPRQGDANATMFRVDANNPQILASKTINIVDLAGNGERAHFTGAFQVGNKVYAPYMCIKGITGSAFHTNYTDSSWVAVFSYPDLNLERVIRDNRTSYFGYYFAQNCLKEVENGDVYAFSRAVVEGAGVVPSTKPSAIVRIKKDATEFDKSYFFNVQEKSGGHHLSSEKYFGDGKFLLTMFAEAGKTSGNVKYAIADVFAETFTWVTGIPSAPTHVGMHPYVWPDKKSISLGITTDADGPYIYNINVNGTATRGMQVESGSITAVGSLEY